MSPRTPRHEVEHPLEGDLAPGEDRSLQIEQRLVGDRVGPKAAEVDAPQAARELDVDVALLEAADQPVELLAGDGARHDDHAAGAVLLQQIEGVLDRPEPRRRQPAGEGGAAVADHAVHPKAGLGVGGDELDDVRCFRTDADDHDVPAVAAVPPSLGQVGPEHTAAGDEEHEAEGGPDQRLRQPGGHVEDAGEQDLPDCRQHRGPGQARQLHGPDGRDPCQVQLLHAEQPQPEGGRPEDDQQALAGLAVRSAEHEEGQRPRRGECRARRSPPASRAGGSCGRSGPPA